MLQRAIKQILISNDQGFTLVELMVAVVILMVGLLGTLQGVNVAIQENMKNEYRNQAVAIAEAKVAEVKSMPFANISTVTKTSTKTVSIRGFTKQYTIVDQRSATGTNTKNIQVGVSWLHKGATYEQEISSLVSDPNAN